MKRICALLLAVLLILTVFTGCGGKSVTVKKRTRSRQEEKPLLPKKRKKPRLQNK